jgi:5-methylcytosine-specific restriction enzyme subunit McrC
VEHKLHYIIYKTIRLLRQINTNADLSSRIATLLLNFPEMPDVDISASTFESIIYNRKNVSYKKCIEIARLLLLHYHPDVSKGRNNVLALMFDMNKLWEQFVYVSIRNHKNVGNRITAQTSKNFWKPNVGQCSTIRPDIVINISNNEHCVVLDTKWKNLNGYNPSPEDLRQMYVYHQYYAAKRVALVYPGNGNSSNGGYYLHPQTNEVLDMECSVIAIDVDINVKEWQKKICKNIEDWFSVKSLAEVIL